jgi:hypothetical protein
MAVALPVSVTVDIIREWLGYRLFNSSTSGIEAMTSPTDTECIQMAFLLPVFISG